MTTILFVWMTVAVSSGSSGREYRAWQALAEFTSPEACQAAIEKLGIASNTARCVVK
jgi:hypothetical protein